MGKGISELLTGPVKCVFGKTKTDVNQEEDVENEVKNGEFVADRRKRLCWCGKYCLTN